MRTEDGDLIYRCLNGEPEAFGFLADKYKESVYGLAYAMLLNFDDAEDVTQEVFITAYKKLQSLKKWDSFRLWLYSITRNACKMFIRSKSKRPDREYLEDKDTKILEKPSIDAYREDSNWQSLNEPLYEALNSLPEMYRQVLSLYYLSEMTSKEISESLIISPMTVLQRLNRARALLRKEMLEMMAETFENRKLASGFTFRILESIKRIKIQPMTHTNGVPWGLSLATGIMFVILGLNPNFNNPAQNSVSIGNLLSGESKVLEFGEIPVNIAKIANKPVISKGNGKGDGINLNTIQTKTQNIMSMAPQGEGGTWTKKANMPTPRLDLRACVVDGIIYAIGGSRNGSTVSTVEAYDPKTDTWTKKADMPTPRRGLSTSVVDGTIYIIGGSTVKGSVLPNVEAYDPKIDIWTKKRDMPTPRTALSAIAADGIIYAIGGYTTSPVSTVEAYDPKTDTWKTKKADMPTPRYGLSLCVLNGIIYAIEGTTNNGNNDISAPVLEVYNPKNDTWIKKGEDIPPDILNFTAVVINKTIYAITVGGIVLYDLATDTWTERKTPMPTIRYWVPTSVVNGKIYTIGGGNAWDVALDEGVVEEYIPEGWPFYVSLQGKLPTKWGAEKSK